MMADVELDSFIMKFKSISRAGFKASLKAETADGIALYVLEMSRTLQSMLLSSVPKLKMSGEIKRKFLSLEICV